MVWQISKVMDVGTSNPIVARLGMGLSEIIQMARLPEEKKVSLRGCCIELMSSLVQAQQAAGPLMDELKSIESKIVSEGVKTQDHGRVIETPGVMKIDDARVFLKYGKQALQNLAKAMGIILDRKFDGPHFHKVKEVARERFGVDNPVVQLIVDDEPWIKELIDLRNEDEHPSSGKQFIRGFSISPGEGGSFLVDVPRFYNDSPVLKRLEVFSHNLLTFSEELLAVSLAQFFPPIVALYEIPEEQRDPTAPVRFRLGLKEGFELGGERA